MKKAFLVMISILLLFVAVCPTAFASTTDEFLKVTTDNTIFYYDTNPNALFELKKGVYVKFLNAEDGYYKVEYYGATGYVKSSDFSDTTKYSGLSQYYHNKVTLHVTDSAVASGNNSLNISPEISFTLPGSPSLTSNDELTLLGTYTSNSITYLYVSFTTTNGTTYFGAINKTFTDWDETANPIIAPMNSTPDSSPSPDSESNDDSGSREPTNNLVRVLLIIGICIPAFIIVYLIFKPVKPSNSGRLSNKNPKRRDEDYEDFE